MEVDNSCIVTVHDGYLPPKSKEKDVRREHLSKKLSYILRYGALKEGLQVDSSGFVSLQELLTVPVLARYSFQEIMEEIKTSQSQRGSNRFEYYTENGISLVRAAYGRKLEKNPRHNGSSVFTLLESCMQVIVDNLEKYDLQDFPDDYLIGLMLSRLARQKRLNNASLKVLLVPALEHLNLENVFLTQNTLRIVYDQCPHLKSLSLRNCGYIATDSVISQLTKKLPNLEFLNLTGCNHLTDHCLKILVKNLPYLSILGLSFNNGITEAGVIELLQKASSLKLLDVFGLKVSSEGKEKIDLIRTEQGIVVILNGLEEKDGNGTKRHIQPTYQKGMM